MKKENIEKKIKLEKSKRWCGHISRSVTKPTSINGMALAASSVIALLLQRVTREILHTGRLLFENEQRLGCLEEQHRRRRCRRLRRRRRGKPTRRRCARLVKLYRGIIATFDGIVQLIEAHKRQLLTNADTVFLHADASREHDLTYDHATQEGLMMRCSVIAIQYVRDIIMKIVHLAVKSNLQRTTVWGTNLDTTAAARMDNNNSSSSSNIMTDVITSAEMTDLTRTVDFSIDNSDTMMMVDNHELSDNIDHDMYEQEDEWRETHEHDVNRVFDDEDVTTTTTDKYVKEQASFFLYIHKKILNRASWLASQQTLEELQQISKTRIVILTPKMKDDNNNAEILTCHVCCRTFAKTFHYLQHIRVHYRLNLYLCKYCKEAFVQQNGLNYHVKHCCALAAAAAAAAAMKTSKITSNTTLALVTADNNVTTKAVTKAANVSTMTAAKGETTAITINGVDDTIKHYELCESCDRFFENGRELRNHVLQQHATQNIDLGINRTQQEYIRSILSKWDIIRQE